MQTILIVEDERYLARLVRDYLDRAGYRAVIAEDVEGARLRTSRDRPHLIVLDLGLPDGNGLDFLRDLRRGGNLPVIILTARSEEVDRIVGLELGADDYVVKPFSPGELVARVRAVLRRGSTPVDPPTVIEAGEMELDLLRMQVTIGGRPVDFTATEFQLLSTMAREPGRVFTRGQLLNVVHGSIVEAYERAIDAHIKNIRRKLQAAAGQREYVQTVHGVGYRFADVPHDPT